MLSATPVITSVIATELGSTNNYSITINGSNLGTSAAYSGSGSGDLVVVDAGVFAAGQAGDGVGVNVTSWTNNQIIIDGLSGSYGVNGALISPADSLVISVTNPQTNVAAVTYQTVPGTPQIDAVSVQRLTSINNWAITINGHGLGLQAAYTGDNADLKFVDTAGPWAGGKTGNGVTADVTSWTNDQIVIGSLSGAYGTNGWVVNPGDTLIFTVNNPQDGLAAPQFSYAIATPDITSISIQAIASNPNNWQITINGTGFGTQGAYNGDSADFKLVDTTGPWAGGNTGNGVTANVTSWTDSQIVVSGLTGAYGTNGWVINTGNQLSFTVNNVQDGLVSNPASYTVPALTPVIASVATQLLAGSSNNWDITINGSGFGAQSPYNGDSTDLKLVDTTGPWAGGNTGNGVTANVTSWTDSQIVISGLTGAYGTNGWVISPGDALAINVSNPQSGIAATTFSYAMPTTPNPVISSVSSQLLAGTSNNWQITIDGSGFGVQSPYNGDSADLKLVDTAGPWAGGNTGDGVTTNVTSWTNTQIVISGLTGAYGTNGWIIASGNNVTFTVINPQSGVPSSTFRSTIS
jgi:hypothetical protein